VKASAELPWTRLNRERPEDKEADGHSRNDEVSLKIPKSLGGGLLLPGIP